ncbi:hypothetical protein L484_007527 [Morus notabilis]|uniref:Uncharacterized protein n=1 Tax=Morus notabilis TaxID=981085 RepID=W9RAE3_9ROSA|nr:hypothetical protein L484_007527 [Morus notabilis]
MTPLHQTPTPNPPAVRTTSPKQHIVWTDEAHSLMATPDSSPLIPTGALQEKREKKEERNPRRENTKLKIDPTLRSEHRRYSLTIYLNITIEKMNTIF